MLQVLLYECIQLVLLTLPPFRLQTYEISFCEKGKGRLILMKVEWKITWSLLNATAATWSVFLSTAINVMPSLITSLKSRFISSGAPSSSNIPKPIARFSCFMVSACIARTSSTLSLVSNLYSSSSSLSRDMVKMTGKLSNIWESKCHSQCFQTVVVSAFPLFTLFHSKKRKDVTFCFDRLMKNQIRSNSFAQRYNNIQGGEEGRATFPSVDTLAEWN